jgi:hypothetical protein
VSRAQLYCSTWTRDSHGLFDYESNYTVDIELPIDSPCKIVRCESLNIIKEECTDVRLPSTLAAVRLANVASRHGKLWVFDPLAGIREPAQEQLWVVLRNLAPDAREPGYKLQLGDVIRFGKLVYAIKELVIEPVPEPGKRRQLGSHADAIRTECEICAPPHDESCLELVGKAEPEDRPITPLDGPLPQHKPQPQSQAQTQIQIQLMTQTQGLMEAGRCRICLGSDSKGQNPLISLPCRCIGTVELIHVVCFQQWMRSKVTVQMSPCVSVYSWTPFECDVCKQKFPGISSLASQPQI